MYLIDTNIFIEGLLEQGKSSRVEEFLSITETNEIFVSDFSLYSIGIILHRLNKNESFETFLKNVIIDRISVLKLDLEDLLTINKTIKQFNLDFDDAYQYLVAKKNNLKLVTFDLDFKSTDLVVTSI